MSSRTLMPSRRHFIAGSAALIASCALPASHERLFAQKASLTGKEFRAAGKSATISTRSLRNNISLLMGSGGNMIALPGPDGMAIVDSGLATSRGQIRAALDALSPDPVRQLLNTHWHFDHTDGNEWMHLEGATIVAHENTRRRMLEKQSIPAFSIVLGPSPAAALPTLLFNESHTLQLNGQAILMKRYTPAHTDSDISVFFENANILHTGDSWFNGYYPFIDYDSGGSIDGMIAASFENLDRTDAATLVLPGHGDVGSRAELVAFNQMLLDVRSRVSALKAKGMSLASTIAAKPTAKYDNSLSHGFVSPDLFTSLVYRGVD